MRQRTNLLLGLTALLAVVMAAVSSSQPVGRWQIFLFYLVPGFDKRLLQGRSTGRSNGAFVQRTLRDAVDHVAAVTRSAHCCSSPPPW